MRIILPVIFILFGAGCSDDTAINNNEEKSGNIEDTVNYVETNALDSITYKLSLNGEQFSHLDSIRVHLDIINFSVRQTILVDTFYREYGIKVLDELNNSPVVAYWSAYRSTSFDSNEEVQDRKIAIGPQSEVRISYWLTNKLDFELRNKVVPKGQYTVYYWYAYSSEMDSSYVVDSTASVKFYLEKNCGEVKN